MCVTDQELSPNQKRTLAARRTFAGSFATPEEKRAHYRALGTKAAAGRLVLSASDAQAVAEAMRLLAPVMAKIQEAGRD